MCRSIYKTFVEARWNDDGTSKDARASKDLPCRFPTGGYTELGSELSDPSEKFFVGALGAGGLRIFVLDWGCQAMLSLRFRVPLWFMV